MAMYDGAAHVRLQIAGAVVAIRPCARGTCAVSPSGIAGCGSPACPACGHSGANLSAPDGFDGDALVRCTCGTAWAA